MGLFVDFLHKFGPSRAPVATDPAAHEHSPSYPAVVNRAWLWWRDGNANDCVPAHLVRIGMMEALVVADRLPPPEEPVWLRVEEPVSTEWIKAKVEWHQPPDQQVLLEFTTPFTYDAFKALADGYGLQSRFQIGASPEFDGRHWR